jgi:L-iditol 2-dehydrogenase
MYYNNQDIRLEDLPKPQIRSGELLVCIEASGICGSDVMEWYRAGKAPCVLGHEIGGWVVEVGKGVKNYKVGDRISASHHVPCNTCHYCLRGHHTACETLRRGGFDPGGFAEYVRLPAINVDRGVYPLPDEVSFEEATFIEPLACVVRAQKLASLQPGDTVLVIGSGISGVLHINLASALGACRIIAVDINTYRLKLAKEFGADEVICASEEDVPERVREVNEGRLADFVIVCTGAKEAVLNALHSVERGGTVLFFAPTNQGITIPLSINELFWRREVTLTTSYAGTRQDHITALKLIWARRVKVREMITHRFPLKDTSLGFQLVAKAKDSLKVIIEPQK